MFGKKVVQVQEQEKVELGNIKLLLDIIKDHQVSDNDLKLKVDIDSEQLSHAERLSRILHSHVDVNVNRFNEEKYSIERAKEFINPMKELGFPIIVYETILNEFKYHSNLFTMNTNGVCFDSRKDSWSRGDVKKFNYSGDVPDQALDLIEKYIKYKNDGETAIHRSIKDESLLIFGPSISMGRPISPYLVTIHSNEPLNMTYEYRKYSDPVVIAWSPYINVIDVDARGTLDNMHLSSLKNICMIGAVIAYWDSNGNL